MCVGGDGQATPVAHAAPRGLPRSAKEIADFSNTGDVRPDRSRALFLKEFVGGVPWAHLDTRTA
jgi:leucyl aminopeptidase